MRTIRTLSLKGKTINVPHLEHREGAEKNTVTFSKEGLAEVNDSFAASILEHYPFDVEIVQAKAAKA